MTVCVIIPAYNAAAFIRDTLKSLQTQTMHEFRAIVVDDGSTDNTASVVKSVASEEPRLQVISRPNGGPSAAMNTGLAQLTSDDDAVFFLGSDDLLEPETLETLYEYLEANRSIGAVGCQVWDLLPDGRKIQARRTRYVPGRIFPRDLGDGELDTPFVSFLCVTGNGAFYLYRRSILDQVGPYDESLWSHEDSDLLCRVSLTAPVHLLPRPMYVRRVREGSLRHSANMDGYGDIFNGKWERGEIYAEYNRLGIDFEAALKYKHTRHVPFRDLKIAVAKVRRSMHTFDLSALSETTALLLSAVKGFTGKKWKKSRELRNIALIQKSR